MQSQLLSECYIAELFDLVTYDAFGLFKLTVNCISFSSLMLLQIIDFVFAKMPQSRYGCSAVWT
jgi:hypothetical protein